MKLSDRDIVVGLERRRRRLFDRADGEWSPRAGPEVVEGRPFDVFAAPRAAAAGDPDADELADIIEANIPRAELEFAEWLVKKRAGNPIDPEHLRLLLARLRRRRGRTAA